MAPKPVKNAPKDVNSDEERSDERSEIFSSVVPVKPEKKKRVMTPEMLEILRLARLKSIETKKALSEGGAEKRLEFYTEKVVKQQVKESVSKKGLKARAVAQLAGEVLPELPVVAKKEPKVKPAPVAVEPVEKNITIPESVLTKLIQNISKLQPKQPEVVIPVAPVVAPVPEVAVEKVKKKKVVKYVYEESTDSEGEDRVVVVKKKEKELPKLEQRAQNLLKPKPQMNSYNIFGQRRL